MGIRRTGKTQVIKRALLKHTAATGGAIAYLDVSNYTSLHQFYSNLWAALPHTLMQTTVDLLQATGSVPDKIVNWFRGHIDKVKVPGFELDLHSPQDISARLPWQPVAQALLQAVDAVEDRASLPVIGLDELPFLLQNLFDRRASPQEVTVALATLRQLRDAGLRMVIGGSISLESLLSLHNISHTVLGGLRREWIPPFTAEEAQIYLDKRLDGLPAAPSVAVALSALPDWVPDFLNETARYLRVLPTAAVMDDEVLYAMRHQVLPAIHASFVKQFEERLALHYVAEELSAAEALLDSVAVEGGIGSALASRALNPSERRALMRLQSDMFLIEADGFGYRFSLNVLRQWWCKHRGLADGASEVTSHA